MIRAIYALTLLMILTATSAFANLVQNPSFENGLADTIPPPNWSLTLAAAGSNFCLVCGSAHTGHQEATFGATAGLDDTISQSFATTPGATYTFSFWFFSLQTQNHLKATWNGTTVFEQFNVNTAYVLESFSLIASGSTTTIAFAGYNGPNWTSVDDVSVELAGTTAPEPASILLLLSGAAVMLCVRARRT